MEDSLVRRNRIKGLLLGRMLISEIRVIDCMFDEDKALESRKTLSVTKYVDPAGIGDIDVEIIYSKKQVLDVCSP